MSVLPFGSYLSSLLPRNICFVLPQADMTRTSKANIACSVRTTLFRENVGSFIFMDGSFMAGSFMVSGVGKRDGYTTQDPQSR
jgi:hypothetical protein